jgi:hypothetical protein
MNQQQARSGNRERRELQSMRTAILMQRRHNGVVKKRRMPLRMAFGCSQHEGSPPADSLSIIMAAASAGGQTAACTLRNRWLQPP